MRAAGDAVATSVAVAAAEEGEIAAGVPAVMRAAVREDAIAVGLLAATEDRRAAIVQAAVPIVRPAVPAGW